MKRENAWEKKLAEDQFRKPTSPNGAPEQGIKESKGVGNDGRKNIC